MYHYYYMQLLHQWTNSGSLKVNKHPFLNYRWIYGGRCWKSCGKKYFSLFETQEQKKTFGLDIKILKRLKIKTFGEKVILWKEKMGYRARDKRRKRKSSWSGVEKDRFRHPSCWHYLISECLSLQSYCLFLYHFVLFIGEAWQEKCNTLYKI